MASEQDAFQAALAQARAAAQKFRDEGKLPPEDRSRPADIAPKGAQQIIAAGGQEYRDLGLGNRRSHNAIEAGSYSSGRFNSGGGGGSNGDSGGGGFSGPAGGTGYNDYGRGSHERPQSSRGGHSNPDTYRENFNRDFVSSDTGIGPQGGPPRGGYGGPRGGYGGADRGGHEHTGVSRRGFEDGPGNHGGPEGGPMGPRGGFRGGYRGRGGFRGRGRGGFHGPPGGHWEEGPQEDPDADFKVFVGGLARETTTERLQEYFKQFGDIKYCQVKVDPSTGTSRGFGFVVYNSTDAVDNVIKTLPHTVDGKRVDAKRQHLKTRDGDDKLFCGGVPSDFTDGQLAEFFSTYGMVDAVERPRDMVTGLAKGFAFITFKDPGIVDLIKNSARWLTLPNGARIECKAAVPQNKQVKGAMMTGDGGYGAGYGTGYDPVSGVGFVGEDWQSYDWNKLAQNDPKAQQNQAAAQMGQMSGMEGMSQKQMNKQMKKMMKQWNSMMEMMGGGDQNAMMQMMTQMASMDPAAMAGGTGAPPPPPPEDSAPKRSRFTPY